MERRVKKFDGLVTKRSFIAIVTALLGREERVRPSEYLEQILLTTAERIESQLKSKSRPHVLPISDNPIHNDFEPIPNILIFQQFHPGKAYQITLTIRNNAKTPRFLKYQCEENNYFSVEFRGNMYTSVVAPGLTHVYSVKFTPDARKDYEHNLEFATDTGNFIVPAIAIGPRAILDFPDKIEIPDTAVKIPAFKSLLIRNIGNARANFNIYGKNPRFWIEPSKGEITEEEAVQFTVYFLSKEAGNFESQLYLQYDTGETLEIAVRCSSENCPIRIDRTTLRIDEMYIGLSKSRTVTIYNRSDYLVKYEWLLLENEQADEEYKRKYEGLLESMCVMQLPRCVDLVYQETCTPDTHEIACQRIHKDELEILKQETFPYKHKGFSFVPERGEVWPQSSADVTVYFAAYQFGEITSTAYLEVTGLEGRIPLRLHGVGKGPVFRLNVVTIDMQNIYLCSQHNYEIIAVNDGHIPGTLIYQSKHTDFGGIININPARLSMEPDEQRSFNLYFTSNKKGDFIERIDFIIEESKEVLSLHIKGQIICPTLHFDRHDLVFVPTALGFSTKQEVCLRNMSSVPVTFSITVENDGDEHPLTYERFMNSKHKPTFPSNPKEFNVTPADGVVSALQTVTIRIIYTANIARHGDTNIRVDMWDSDSDPVILPVSFCGKVASLCIIPPEVVVRFCFLNFPYSRTFLIENKSDLDGYFVILPQSVSDSTPIVYSLSTYQGFIKAQQTREISATIMTRMLGKQRASISMLVMGLSAPAEFCVIECNGQGPVISAQPTVLDFGEVRVLQEKTLVFSLISDSPIPADFKANLEKKNSPWNVCPNAGNLEPNGSMDISVSLNLRDPGIYVDNIVIHVVSSRPIQVKLAATGTGCGVVFKPNIFPVFDIGRLFSVRKLVQPVTVENNSSINYQILWSNVPEFHLPKGSASLASDSRFQVQPLHFELPAGTTKIVHCRLKSNICQSVQENWYIFAQVLPIGKRELLGQSTFTVTLAEPQIVFDKTELAFQYSIYPRSEDNLQRDEFVITNKTELSLAMHLTVKAPFYLITDEDEHVDRMNTVLPSFASKTIRVYFWPKVVNKQQSSEYSEIVYFTYDDNIDKKDKIVCKAVVHVPKLTLSSKNLIIDCELGSHAVEVLKFQNEGPIPVTYELTWMGETINIDRHSEVLNISKAYSTPLVEVSKDVPIEFFNDLSYLVKDPGDGDGPTKTTSVVQLEPKKSKASTKEEPNQQLQMIKDSLIPIVKPCCSNNGDCSCEECIEHEPLTDNHINKILSIVPCQGTMEPYSTEEVSVHFYGQKQICAVAKIMCTIVDGPTEEINVLGRSDVPRFFLDKSLIDFGEQLFGEVCQDNISLKNESMIALTYQIDLDEQYPTDDEPPNSDLLQIQPQMGRVDPGCAVEFNIEYRTIILGPTEFHLKLKVANLEPREIVVKAIGAFPQVYPCLPYENLKEPLSAGLDYRGIQLLTPEFVVTRPTIAAGSCKIMEQTEQISEEEVIRLANEDWYVLPHNEIVPTIMDVNMAIERLLAKYFVNKNCRSLSKWNAVGQELPIPGLICPKYVISMNYVIVGLTSHYVRPVINYGPSKCQVRLKRSIKATNALKKFGIVLQFHWNENLKVGDSLPLRVTWHAKPENFAEKETNVKQAIHLEVIHGPTLPIMITGTVTYPSVNVTTKFLEFNDTIIGECSVKHVLIKNEGLVRCEWSVQLESRRKHPEEQAFRLNYNSTTYAPGEFGFIHIYFKPIKPGRTQDKASVIVKMGQEDQTINLVGYGIPLRLNITNPSDTFPTIVPFSEIHYREFFIENVCRFPVEYFWHHLDSLFEEEDRICKALMHYYQVTEIVIPRRSLGEPLPNLLVDFYYSLIAEMAQESLLDGSYKENLIEDDVEAEQEVEEDSATQISAVKQKVKRTTSRTKRFTQRKRHQKSKDYFLSDSLADADASKEHETSFESSNLLQELMSRIGPDAIENLLHNYIDKLHEDADYRTRRGNPLQELFGELEAASEDSTINGPPEPLKPKRKICIIFHGAPFTEYQEAASKVADDLRVPLVSLNRMIIDAIALGDDASSGKLRKIVDDAYNEYMAAFDREKTQANPASYRSQSRDESSKMNTKKLKSPRPKTWRSVESPRKTVKSETTPRSARTIKPEEENSKVLKWYTEPNPLEEFNKIPNPEELVGLDILSRYEYKIDAILTMQKILSSRGPSGTPRTKLTTKQSEKSNRRTAQGDTFLNIDPELLADALENRLAEMDFRQGFVVDSLKNNFLNSDSVLPLKLLLKAVGHVQFLLLVTFLSTIDICSKKITDLRNMKKDTNLFNKKLQDIDEMSSSEYELLSEEDRKIYLDAIIPPKKQEALQRHMLYAERLNELKNNHSTSKTRTNRLSVSKNIKEQPTARKGKTKARQSIDQGKAASPRNNTRRDSSRVKNSAGARAELYEIQRVRAELDKFYSDFSELENVFRNWDPIERDSTIQVSTARAKAPQTAKSTRHAETNEELVRNNFHTWYVHMSNPWSKTMYSVIVSQIKSNSLIQDILQHPEVLPDQTLSTKIYSVLTAKEVIKRDFDEYSDAFRLMFVPNIGTLVMNGNSEEREYNKGNKSEKEKSLEDLTIKSFDPKNSTGPDSDALNEKSVKPRYIIQPNETQRFRVYFEPWRTGEFQRIFTLTVTNSYNVTRDIKISGSADVPRLDMKPEAVFAKVKERKEDVEDEPTYFLDENIIDFGALLMTKGNGRTHKKEAELKLRNISKLSAEVDFALSCGPSLFSVYPDKLHIPPGETGLLILSATAPKVGENTESLYISVKNNPKVETIKMLSNGTVLNIYLSDKEISFDRVLLYRSEVHTLIIYNKCAISLYWCFKDDSTESQIMLQPIRGMIKPWSEDKVVISYYGSKVGEESKTAIFHIFLSPHDEEPILTDMVNIWGKTYDVAVDITHANPIDLKTTIVNNPKSTWFTLKNRGEHDVKFVFTVADDEVLAAKIPNTYENLKDDIEVLPVTGVLAPQKEMSAQVIFAPKSEVVIRESPILTCHLLDVFRENRMIAEIPLRISAAAYYNAFAVHPSPDMDFGPLGLCTKKTMYLTVKNLGKFPFQYTVNAPGDKGQLEKGMLNKKEILESKRPVSSKRDKKNERISCKFATETLKIGSMTIEKTKGDVNVDESDEIPITCYTETLSTQEETIVIMVPNCQPEKQLGKTVKLRVNCYLPGVDFADLDSIFQGNYLVDQIENFYCPTQLGAHTVFSRQEKCLYFRRVKLFATHTASFRLYNRNLVPATVQVVFQSDSFAPNTGSTETFSVEPQSASVPASSCKEFKVSFTPVLIESFKGALEVAVVLPSHIKSETLLIKLIGESCLPQITILEPLRGIRNHILLNFGRSLVNEKREKHIVLKNNGLIEAKIVFDIFEDRKFAFSILSKEEAHPLPSSDSSGHESLDTCTVVRLMPEHLTELQVTFHPNELDKYQAELHISVVDNPYENIKLMLVGEGFTELIVLEDLDLAENKERRSKYREAKTRKITSRTSRAGSIISGVSIHPANLIYNLDYGLCFVNKMYKRSFKIANKSTERWFKFQWSAHPDIVFMPTIGCLKYQTTKEITANFLTGQSKVHANTCIECEVCEIKIDESLGELAWDDRQTEVRWENVNYSISSIESDLQTVMRKVVEPTAQPIYEVFSDTTKYIHLLLNATVAFSTYSCSVKEIQFGDTLMLQKREFKIVLSNPGIVNLVYTWKIEMDERYPRRFAENSPKATSRQDNGDVNVKLSRQTLYLPTTADCEDSPRQSDLFSSSGELTDRSHETKLESYDFPFKISLSEGTILPGESTDCILEFSPKDVFCYKANLTCKMENLNPDLANLAIPITARSLLPYCHFEIKESDYITGKRRTTTQPGPIGYDVGDPTLWENIRVVEFKVIGVGETHVKKFDLINPTTENYRFAWKDRTFYSDEEVPKFHCLTTEGMAVRGKRVELAFSFLAEDVGTFESFWLFCIDSYKLKSLFLLVAVVAEPLVHSLTADLKLKPTVLGCPVRDSIKVINEESFSIPFKISQQSLCSEGKSQDLTILPMLGKLIAKEEQTLSLEYQPTLTGEFNFRVQCHVKWMKNPLTICVNAHVYRTMSSVFYTDTIGETTEALENTRNIVDFGKLMLAEPGTVEFHLSNSGELTFYFAWELGVTPGNDKSTYIIKISDLEDELPKGSRLTCTLSLVMFERRTIKDHPIFLKISGGPTYRFLINASAKKPSVKFSFNQHDFGACYIQDESIPGYEIELFITNSEQSAFVIECTYEEKPHILVNLESLSEALKPRSSIAIPITFRPLKEAKYTEILTFTINRMMEKKIIITGEGITYKIHLVNPRDKLVDLGNVLVNKMITKRVAVVNEGSLPVTVQFGLMKDLRGDLEHHEDARDCRTLSQIDAIKSEYESTPESKRFSPGKPSRSSEPDYSQVLMIEPSANTILGPNKKINVVVKFKPTRRMKAFSEKVAVQTSRTLLPLFVIRGSCVGAAFQLSKALLSFGTIVQNYVAEARILLMNTGDIGARFKWNTTKWPRDFTISPVSGYCSPGMDISFLVKFQPTQEYNLLEATIPIEIEKYGLLSVKIVGSSCNLPAPTDTLYFEANVRDKDIKSIRIANDTNSSWELKPEIIGEHFTAENVVTVPPYTSKTCLITYYPITMTAQNESHKAMLFLKIPDSNPPVLYALRGAALPPLALATLIRDFPAKTKYTECLTVYNWLNRQERFFCNIELRNEGKETPSFNFTGSNTLDIPANSQRDYRAVFHSYEEYDFHFLVTFTNQEDEYQYYEINYKVTSPEIIESIKLTTIARNPACYSLKLQNPMEDRELIYTAQCTHSCVKIHGAPKTVPPLSHQYISIKYDPLLPSDETIVKCNVYCRELGRFPYELRLKALPAPPEKLTHVTATLGSATTFTLPIKNHTDRNCDFTVTVDNDSLICEKKVSIPKQKEHKLDIIFEPYDTENIIGNVVVSSSIAGEFIFPIIASYSLPKPAGPYVITREAEVSIPFRNIFRQARTFNVILEPSEHFRVVSSSETIQSKQTTIINVGLRNPENDLGKFMLDDFSGAGKLIINCPDPEVTHINWIYYLHAIFD